MSKKTTINNALILKRTNEQDLALGSLSFQERLIYRYPIAEIIMRFEEELNAKTNVYDFLFEKEMMSEFQDWSLKRQRAQQ